MPYTSSDVTNRQLVAWVKTIEELCQPDAVHWCDGSVEEYDRLCEEMIGTGTLVRLNADAAPIPTSPDRTPPTWCMEDRTFICSLSKGDAGPTNNWVHPKEMKAELQALRRFDARPDDVCDSVQHGTAGFADCPHRRAADRLALRRRQHADHDADGAIGD